MMSELKFTPGPWVARRTGAGCSGTRGWAIDFNADEEQVVDFVYEEADARLIAAAPDLVADLIVAASTLRRYEQSHRAKGTEESTAKAEVNADLATRFEATIRKATA